MASKLIYALAAAITLSYALGVILAITILRTRNSWLGEYAPVAIALITIFSLSTVVVAYRSQSGLLRPTGVSSTTLSNIFIGVGSGAAISFFALLFSSNEADSRLEALAVFHSVSWPGALTILLVLVALPILGELVFRGIVFRTLVEHSKVPAAVIASALLFAYFWPIFIPVVRFAFGAVSALTFYRTKSLVPSIIANVVLSLSGCALVLYHVNHPGK